MPPAYLNTRTLETCYFLSHHSEATQLEAEAAQQASNSSCVWIHHGKVRTGAIGKRKSRMCGNYSNGVLSVGLRVCTIFMAVVQLRLRIVQILYMVEVMVVVCRRDSVIW